MNVLLSPGKGTSPFWSWNRIIRGRLGQNHGWRCPDIFCRQTVIVIFIHYSDSKLRWPHVGQCRSCRLHVGPTWAQPALLSGYISWVCSVLYTSETSFFLDMPQYRTLAKASIYLDSLSKEATIGVCIACIFYHSLIDGNSAVKIKQHDIIHASDILLNPYKYVHHNDNMCSIYICIRKITLK